MPRLVNQKPRYSRKRNQAVVHFGGKAHYLGEYNSPASLRLYRRLVAEWIASDCPTSPLPASSDLTVNELCAAYWRYAKQYYRKATGEPTGELHPVRSVIRRFRKLYGDVKAVEFGPVALKAVIRSWIDDGLVHTVVNRYASRLRRIVEWAVSEQMLPVDVNQALKTVKGERKGYTKAKTTERVRPVSDTVIEATIPFLPPIVADMVKLQRWTGARPGEICLMRPCDIDRTTETWEYRPHDHKNAHRGKDRIIFIGAKGQEVLARYLLRANEVYCFSPEESEAKRRSVVHSNRQTPLNYGNRPGSNRKRKPQCTAGKRYSTGSYRRAIERACEKAFGMPLELRRVPKEMPKDERRKLLTRAAAWRKLHTWNPNQIRHTVATEARAKFGMETAAALLGHSNLPTTQIYAEQDRTRAVAYVEAVG